MKEEVNKQVEMVFEKLIVLDKYEVLRNGVWDFLTASNEKHAMKLANLVKDMAEAENLAIRRVNDFDLMNRKRIYHN